jgi:hypothetical protein
MVVEPDLPTDNPMSPSQLSQNNAMAASDEDYLPPVTDSDGEPLPLDEFGGMTDEAPPEVRRAAANIPETGVLFNLEPFEQIIQLHADGRADEARKIYNSLDAQSRYVYENARNKSRFTEEEGARLADEFRKMRDQQNAPQSRLAETRLSAIEQGTKEDAKKTYQRADNMIFLLDNLRGGPRDKVPKESEKWRSRVGSVQGRWPTILSGDETLGWNADFSSLKGAINLTEAQGNKGQGPLSDGERVLMAQAASLGLEQARDEPGFEKAFERMYDMALEARNASMSKLSGGKEAPGTQAPAAPAKPRRVSGGITYEKGEDGLWNPVQ